MMSGLPDGMWMLGSTVWVACAPLDALLGNTPHAACRLPDHGGMAWAWAVDCCWNWWETYDPSVTAAAPRRAGTSWPLTGASFMAIAAGSADAGTTASVAVTSRAPPTAASTRLLRDSNDTLIPFPSRTRRTADKGKRHGQDVDVTPQLTAMTPSLP